MPGNFKNIISRHIKNSFGWTTKRKLIVFTVDDYGAVRIASKKARENLLAKGVRVDSNKFDMFDGLEDPEDLSRLFDTLNSVKDSNGSPAIFTAMSLPANPDFERMIEERFSHYRYELLTETWKKIPGYEGNGRIWQQGIENHLILPQFHGREHLNVKFLMEALRLGDKDTMACFENRSYGAISVKLFPSINYVAAFDFENYSENEALKEIALDGLSAFESVFKLRARHFASPGRREHKIISESLNEAGIIYLDSDMIRKEHQGNGKYKWAVDYTGKMNALKQIYLVRNVVFEPEPSDSFDWIGYCMKQIDIAFRWKKPVNISSHRVNFSGHIDPENRNRGLLKLGQLLKEIVKRWPDAEFITSVQLGDMIRESNQAIYNTGN